MKNLFKLLTALLFLSTSIDSFEIDEAKRVSSFPFLSGDTWRFFCDWRLGKFSNFAPDLVKRGDSIFVEYDSLDNFSKNYLPKIRHPFILITPNCERGSDNPQPGEYEILLRSNKLVAWFLQNLDRPLCQKIVPIPIGLANRGWPYGNIDKWSEYIHLAEKSAASDRETLLYANFSLYSNPKERNACLEHCKKLSFAKVECAEMVSRGSVDHYLESLSKATFVISPPGNGLDCHRTWEALLMGCYPIVKSSTLNPLYEGLPVVKVNAWAEVTEELLRKKCAQFKLMSWSKEKLYAPYWFDLVRKLQGNLRKSVK